jgi:hypothetical protein
MWDKKNNKRTTFCQLKTSKTGFFERTWKNWCVAILLAINQFIITILE